MDKSVQEFGTAVVPCDSSDEPEALDDVRGIPLEAAISDRAPWPSDAILFAPDGHMRRLVEIEVDIIRLAITRYHGHMSEVARRLGIGRSTLYRKISDFQIDTGFDPS